MDQRLLEQHSDLAPQCSRAMTVLESNEAVPAASGVYVAWLVDCASAGDLGLTSTPPVPVYAGRAIARGGLRARLSQHICSGFLDLVEMLALHGRAIHPLGARFLPEALDTSADMGPIAELGFEQACQWQYDHLRWAWLTCSSSEAIALEVQLIRQLRPLLNRSHLPGYPPPQLRGKFDESSRARWLWQMSWAGLLIGQKTSRLTMRERDHWQLDASEARYGIDDLGYPAPDSPRTGASVISNAPPDVNELWSELRRAARNAPASVRQALGLSAHDETVWAYWAAHAAAPFLPTPVPYAEL